MSSIPPDHSGGALAERRIMSSLSPLPPNPYSTYTVVGKLGHGRLAELFLATMPTKTSMPDLVVIKRLHRHLSGEEEFVNAFLDEVRIAVKLDHPNVVKTHDHGKLGEDYFFVMEYMEGQGLDRIMRRCLHRGLAFPPELAADIGIQALEGLHYAHELRDHNGVRLQLVHRDIRPQNIFVTYEGKVKLLDFGLAKAAIRVVQSSLDTVKGRFAYTSPEQVKHNPVDRRADIWSTGVVLWELMAKRSLFSARGSVAAQLKAVMHDPIPDLGEVAPETPEAFVEVVHRALRRDVDERYLTAQAMGKQLAVIVEDLPEAKRQARLHDFMTDMFSDVISRNRSAIAQCLKGQRVSGEFDVPPRSKRSKEPRKQTHQAEGLPRLTMTGERAATEKKWYLIVAAAVVLILLAAVAMRFLGPWGG